MSSIRDIYARGACKFMDREGGNVIRVVNVCV